MGESLRETARQIGVSHSYLSRKAKAGEVPRNADRSFDVAAVRTALIASSDPARSKLVPAGYRNGNQHEPVPTSETLFDLVLRTAAAAQPESEFDLGFISGLLLASYSVGAIGALAAVESGASVEVGRATQDTLTVYFAERSEELMRSLPTFRNCPADEDLPGILYDLDRLWRIDWEAMGAAPNGSGSSVS